MNFINPLKLNIFNLFKIMLILRSQWGLIFLINKKNLYCTIQFRGLVIVRAAWNHGVGLVFSLASLRWASLTFLCLSLVELMSSWRNCDWIWYSRFLSRALSASCTRGEERRKRRKRTTKVPREITKKGTEWRRSRRDKKRAVIKGEKTEVIRLYQAQRSLQ